LTTVPDHHAGSRRVAHPDVMAADHVAVSWSILLECAARPKAQTVVELARGGFGHSLE
jgi:hypothetical protein